MATPDGFRAGHVAIVGRPNVGKSTLLNCLVGQKLAITSKKPQTTRHRITGIVTEADCQLVFVDTPGFQTRYGNALNRHMNRSVTQALEGVDLVLFVVEALRFGGMDRLVLKLLEGRRLVVLVINKVDQVKDKAELLPFMERLSREFPFDEIVPVSAQQGTGRDELVRALRRYLPESPPLYPADELTDASERFLAAELIREKLYRLAGEEIPYATSVLVESFRQEGALRRIHAVIVVDKPSHKAMIIGKGGDKLKQIASSARLDMERLFDGKVFLEVWVKVKRGWADDERALKSLGYE